MKNELITLQQSVHLMTNLESQGQSFHEITDPAGYTWLLDRLRAIGSPDTKSVVFLLGANATHFQQLKRILLEITAVRVERLQDITEQQARAEGVASCAQDLDPDGNGYSPGELFSILWSSINGTDSWNANPWVWVVEFKRVEVANV